MSKNNTPRLGVNIDHVATLREARGEAYPSIVKAAHCALEHGADQITIHLREDRRHIQDTDVKAVELVTKKFNRPLNFEIGASDEMIEMAIAINPDWVCLVPERREEQTTEGGLDLYDEKNFAKIKNATQKLKENLKGIKVSLFVESQVEILKRSVDCGADAVEIHTGDFARAHLNGEDTSAFIESFKNSKSFCSTQKIGHHAGHGLTEESVFPLLHESLFSEYNIGHWIICQSVFEGLGPVVKRLKNSFETHPWS